MPKFNCSYAYNQPSYKDFTVEADTKEQAEAIIKNALKEGRFENVFCDPFFENEGENKRVFVSGPCREDNDDAAGQTMEELIKQSEI